MRVMANGAGVGLATGADMGMNTIETGQDLLVATEAKAGIGLFTVAGIALMLRKRGMTDRPQQSLVLAPMWVMAAETVDLFEFAPQVHRLQLRSRRVAAETKSAAGCFQQPVIVPGVGTMTGTAVALLKGAVSNGKLLPGSFMAVIAEFGTTLFQQARIRRRMGGMTGATLPLLDRLMGNRSGRDPPGNLFMTGEAELCLLLQQQPRVF